MIHMILANEKGNLSHVLFSFIQFVIHVQKCSRNTNFIECNLRIIDREISVITLSTTTFPDETLKCKIFCATDI